VTLTPHVDFILEIVKEGNHEKPEEVRMAKRGMILTI
jgi:hypothetical protein